jgi:CubicO group peptidase (beta-lactamase class C family)
MKHLLFALLLSLLPTPTFADAVDDYLKKELKESTIPGLAVAVLHKGKVVKEQGYGIADLEHQVSVTPDTVFQLGSVGKQFTSGAVVLLAKDGKLRFDDPIAKYLPFAPESWKEVTIHHLLSHTSGIPDYTPMIDLTRNHTAEETAKITAAKPLTFAPGTRWEYSNTNYLLLGIVIEKASGKFYGDVLQERIFQPLGMKTARINSESAIISHRARGYEPTEDGSLQNQSYVAPNINTYADGSVMMSLRDMRLWASALNTEIPFAAEQKRHLWTPARLKDGTPTEYGYGWVVGKEQGNTLIEHGGAWQGFVAHIARYPDHDLTVIVLANRAGANVGEIAHTVAGMYVPALKKTALPPAEQDPEVIALVKTVLAELAENKSKQERFTPEMWELIQPSQSKSLSVFVKALGEPKQIQILRKGERDGERSFEIKITFAKQSLTAILTLDSAGKIAGLLVKP